MSVRHYNFPPMATLKAFEAAARKQSFKDAAQELNVTPGAISHQIKALEGELGVLVFNRLHRGIQLTIDGELLFEAVSSSFSRISQTLQQIRENSIDDLVTIGSTSAVSSLWLLPMVTSFWRENASININQTIQDSPFRSSDRLDMYIRYGRNSGGGMMQTELYRDCLVPVAAPEIAQNLMDCDLAALSSQRLIHLDSDDRSWTSWDDWFRQLGHIGRIASGVRVNNYAIALQAAQDGAGVALGWKRLIRPYLQSGQLVVIPPHSLVAPHQFHLISKPDDQLSDTGLKLRQWIVQECASYSV